MFPGLELDSCVVCFISVSTFVSLDASVYMLLKAHQH